MYASGHTSCCFLAISRYFTFGIVVAAVVVAVVLVSLALIGSKVTPSPEAKAGILDEVLFIRGS